MNDLSSPPLADRTLSNERLAEIDAYYSNEVASGRMAGLVYGIAHHGKLVRSNAIGHADIENGRAMAPDTVFRLYSMTKPIAAVALMILHAEGRFQLDDPVSLYLPEFADMRVLRAADAAPDDTVPAEREMTIRDVLQHTAGLGMGFGIGGTGERLLAEAVVYDPAETLDDQMRKVASIPLCTQPGQVWSYSLSPDIQARLVEILSGESFGAFLQRRLFDPLGMKDTAFAPRPDMVARLARVYWQKDGALSPWIADNVPETPPGLPAWPAAFANLHDTSLSYERGSFGLYSTLDDYLRFAQMLLDGGSHAGGRILPEETVRLMATDHLGEVPMIWPLQGLGFGLGMAVLRDPAKAGYAGTPGMFHWDGAAATIMWIDPKEDLVVVALSQHLMVPGRDPDSFGAEMRNRVYAALPDRAAL